DRRSASRRLDAGTASPVAVLRDARKSALLRTRLFMKVRRPAMPLHHLEHFLIQTEDLEKTKDWYVDVLGMRVGPAPDFKFPVYWLYLGDNDVLHITQGGAQVSENRMKYLGQQSTATIGSGVVD